MGSSPEEARARAEAKFQKQQQADQQAAQANAEREAQAQAVEANTARLKSLLRGGVLCGPKVSRRLLTGALVGLNVIRDLLTIGEAAQARALDGADVHEHILPALIGLDEAVARDGVSADAPVHAWRPWSQPS